MKSNDTINGRTPEEIKKGLECRKRGYSEKCNRICSQCAFYVPNLSIATLYANALAYIHQLERERDEDSEFHKELVETNNNLFAETVEMQNEISALRKELKQVKCERDAAVAEFTEFANSTAICAFCQDFVFDKPCDKGINGEDCWQWRGVQKEVE